MGSQGYIVISLLNLEIADIHDLEYMLPGIMNSILLGDNDEFNADIYESYSNVEAVGDYAAASLYYTRMLQELERFLEREGLYESLIARVTGYKIVEASIDCNYDAFLILGNDNG